MSEKCVLFFEKVRLFSQNGVLFLLYFLINPTMTTGGSFVHWPPPTRRSAVAFFPPLIYIYVNKPGADPGSPIRGAPTVRGGGVPT